MRRRYHDTWAVIDEHLAPMTTYRRSSNVVLGGSLVEAVMSYVDQSIDVLFNPDFWGRLEIGEIPEPQEDDLIVLERKLQNRMKLVDHPEYWAIRQRVERAFVVMDYTRLDLELPEITTEARKIMVFEWIMLHKDNLPIDYHNHPDHPLKYVSGGSHVVGTSLKDMRQLVAKKWPGLTDADLALAKVSTLVRNFRFDFPDVNHMHSRVTCGYCYIANAYMLTEHPAYHLLLQEQ